MAQGYSNSIQESLMALCWLSQDDKFHTCAHLPFLITPNCKQWQQLLLTLTWALMVLVLFWISYFPEEIITKHRQPLLPFSPLNSWITGENRQAASHSHAQRHGYPRQAWSCAFAFSPSTSFQLRSSRDCHTAQELRAASFIAIPTQQPLLNTVTSQMISHKGAWDG